MFQLGSITLLTLTETWACKDTVNKRGRLLIESKHVRKKEEVLKSNCMQASKTNSYMLE